jgi:type I restriction enzyme, R subunit
VCSRAMDGLPRFVRPLWASTARPPKRAFAEFSNSRKLTADQHEFLDLIIDHLTARDVMDPRLLYETPFTDFNAMASRVCSIIPMWSNWCRYCGT